MQICIYICTLHSNIYIYTHLGPPSVFFSRNDGSQPQEGPRLAVGFIVDLRSMFQVCSCFFPTGNPMGETDGICGICVKSFFLETRKFKSTCRWIALVTHSNA